MHSFIVVTASQYLGSQNCLLVVLNMSHMKYICTRRTSIIQSIVEHSQLRPPTKSLGDISPCPHQFPCLCSSDWLTSSDYSIDHFFRIVFCLFLNTVLLNGPMRHAVRYICYLGVCRSLIVAVFETDFCICYPVIDLHAFWHAVTWTCFRLSWIKVTKCSDVVANHV